MIKLLSTLAGAALLTATLGTVTPALADTATLSTPTVQIADGHMKGEMNKAQDKMKKMGKKKRKFPKNVAARKKAFKAMSKGMKGLKKASKQKNKKAMHANAKRVAKAASYLHANVDKLFSKRTSMVKGTRAKKAIWKEWPKFKAGFGALEKATGNLVMAAASGKGVGKAMKAVGKTCGSCHKPFRAKKKKKMKKM